jgi:D-sedoheptulose 7-phosphate isomerase
MSDDPLAGLYPFLHGKAKDAGREREALLESVRAKAADSAAVKRRFFEDSGEAILDAAACIAGVYKNRGRLLVMGNGGSSCDAEHIAVEFLHPVTAGRPSLPAINLASSMAMVTAVANDVGVVRIFARQIDALGRAGDGVVGISTSGESANLLAGFERARAMGLVTVGLAGGDGGAMARSGAVDVCLVVECPSIHRVQECHVALYHILWDLVHTLLADERSGLKER